MFEILTAVAIALTMQTYDDPIEDGTHRSWTGVSYLTVTTDTVDNNAASKKALRQCKREMNDSKKRLTMRGQRILEEMECHFVEGKYEGYYLGRLYFASK
jgi:hypothetical protein